MGRFFLPAFDGLSNCVAKAWVEKLDIYFQLNQVPNIESIMIEELNLEDEAHEWWFHGLSTLGHATMTTYAEFT